MGEGVYIVGVVLAVLVLASCAEPPPDDRMWTYVNDEGRTVLVDGYDRIPEPYRSKAKALGAAPTTLDTQTMYRYTNAAGRPVFVNGIDRVPPDERARAREIDLSDVSTNPELGHDLDTALEREWTALVESDPCRAARDTASAGWLAVLWRENGHLVLLGGGILFLLLITPTMVRRFDAPTWSRVLVIAIPALAFVALFAHAFISTRAALARARTLAEPCEPSALEQTGTGPDALAARLGLVERLRAAIDAADVDSGTHTKERGAR